MEYLSSFLSASMVAMLAVMAFYGLTCRVTKKPELFLTMMMLGVFAKLILSSVGVLISIKMSLISSPLIFGLSYVFFMLTTMILLFSYEMKRVNKL